MCVRGSFALSVYLLRQPDPATPTRNTSILDFEVYRNLSLDHRHSRYVHNVIGTTFSSTRRHHSWTMTKNHCVSTIAAPRVNHGTCAFAMPHKAWLNRIGRLRSRACAWVLKHWWTCYPTADEGRRGILSRRVMTRLEPCRMRRTSEMIVQRLRNAPVFTRCATSKTSALSLVRAAPVRKSKTR